MLCSRRWLVKYAAADSCRPTGRSRTRAVLEAERQFRRIIGYHDLATLAIAIGHDLIARRHTDTAHTPTEEAVT
jgi:hypothetical protein